MKVFWLNRVRRLHMLAAPRWTGIYVDPSRGSSDVFQLQPEERLLRFPRDHFQSGHLSKKFLLWLRRAAEHPAAWRHVCNDASLCSNLSACSDPQMPGHRCLSTDLDEIAKDCGTRNADLGDDYTTPSEHNVVTDLHQIIYLIAPAAPTARS
jgi:hypothetical protein